MDFSQKKQVLTGLSKGAAVVAALLPSWSAMPPKEAAPYQDSRPGFEIVDKKNSRRKIGKRHEAVDESTKVEAL